MNAPEPHYPEPEIELWSRAERAKILIAVLLFCALFWGGLMKAFLL